MRRDLLLRHDRTVHAKDGGIPLHSDSKRRPGSKSRALSNPAKPAIAIDPLALEQIEASSDGMVDLETAAMLMTDLHHKATAAMRSADVDSYENRPDMSLSHPSSLLEQPLITYSSGTISIPWELMSESETDPASHINSDRSQLSQSLPHLLPFNRSDSSSYNGWVSSISSTRSLSIPHKSPCELPIDSMMIPQVLSNDEWNIILEKIKSHDSEQAIPDSFHLPELTMLNRFLASYFSLFHHHLPFLHPASFKPTEVSPSLLLAVLSIGALQVLDQHQAYICHIGSKVLVNQFLQNKENFSSRKCPLWTMQSSLLNMIFASWSGDPKGLEWACSIKSLLANMVAGNSYELKLRTEAREGLHPTRAEWIEDEGCRRTYFAVYILFGLLTLTYNHTPAISFNEFEDLPLPSSEAIWNLNVCNQDWDDKTKECLKEPSFLHAHDQLFQGESVRYSAFATRVMINALFLEVWCLKRSPEALQDVVTEYKLRLALESWEKSLALSESELVSVPISVSHEGHPLVFNAMAIFRNTRARLEVDLKPVQEALRYHDSYEVAAAMSNARDKIRRSSEMLKVIEQCVSCIKTSILHGVRWVARMSATNWGVEHPLCGFDLMIILSLWLYRLENDDEPLSEDETELYNRIHKILDVNPTEIYSTKLSAKVALVWSSMLDEVVVWG